MTPNLLLAAVAGVAAAAAPAPEPQCIVFCAAVEKYDRGDLNKIEYVGEDAYAVWNKLKAVTNFDPIRSKLLIADRDEKGPLPPAGDPSRLTHLPYDLLWNELQEFLWKARPNDLVVLYFGGHGVLKKDTPSAGVFFLPTNFKEHNGTLQKALRMGDVLSQLHVEFAGAKKSVRTVVFANMCHAGAAPGTAAVADDDVGVTVVPQEVKAIRLAYLPACPPSKESVEDPDLGGSVYANRLLAALGGAATDPDTGVVTSGRVLDYLREHIPKHRF